MAASGLEVVESFYASLRAGNIPAVLALFGPDLVWNEAENFPYADRNPYRAGSEVVAGVFVRGRDDWEGFATQIEDIIDAGDRVVALGRYVAKSRRTGESMRAQVAHVWTVAEGKIVAFQQYADTFAVRQAYGETATG